MHPEYMLSYSPLVAMKLEAIHIRSMLPNNSPILEKLPVDYQNNWFLFIEEYAENLSDNPRRDDKVPLTDSEVLLCMGPIY